MSEQSAEVDFFVAPAQVWSSLTTDLKTRAIWLLAQLAFNLVTAQPERASKEVPYVAISSDQPQDSA